MSHTPQQSGMTYRWFPHRARHRLPTFHNADYRLQWREDAFPLSTELHRGHLSNLRAVLVKSFFGVTGTARVEQQVGRASD
jgi:hypothetical protein